MTAKANIIKQATLNFQFYQTENQLAIPGKVENWFLHKALDEIGQVCDELTGDGNYIEIDILEINLGHLTVRQFEKESAHLFKEKLKGEIKAVLAKKDKYVSNPNNEKIDEDKNLASILIHFLNNGYLSWQSSLRSMPMLETALVKALKGNNSSLWEQVISLLQIPFVQTRLAFNFSPAFIKLLIQEVLKYSSSELMLWVDIDNLDTLEKREKALFKLAHSVSDPSFYPPITEKTKAAFDSKKQDKESSYDGKLKEKDVELVEEGVLISNAGVVLMHPFLPALFANLGITKDNFFISKKEREKAIWLLHHMVYGHTELDESMVVLAKLICGISLNDPLHYCPYLSSEEKSEVDLVIEHAIKHWEILKNTGIDSFRETFLKREGEVHIHEKFIEINVEQKAVDMLIGHLPWALSRIKLPWLDKKFHVNWA